MFKPVLAMATTLAAMVALAAPASAAVPPGFADELVTAVGAPTAIAHTP